MESFIVFHNGLLVALAKAIALAEHIGSHSADAWFRMSKEVSFGAEIGIVQMAYRFIK